MKLRQRLLMQNIWILVVAVIVTSCFVFLYNHLYNLLYRHGVEGLTQTTIIIKDDNIIYNENNIPRIKINEILMNISVGNYDYEDRGNKYKINLENFVEDDSDYTIININRILDITKYYKSLFMMITTTFLISFIIANIFLQRKNIKNIINPITNLIDETKKIREGQLDTAITENGYGEIKELGIAIEKLRIQLKDAIYYQEKVDENRKFLISSISHDLKTPVTAIRGYVDGVLDDVADTEHKKREYLSKAMEKTKMVDIMIEDLLLYSKLDLKQMVFERNKVCLKAYMEGCIEENLDEFLRENKDMILENRLEDSVFIKIDMEKFKRVVQNIVDNAKRNIEPERGQLRVILRETNSSAIIEFKDNGRGIDKKDLPYIFQRFYRSDTAREVRGSSGLGLAIAKQIVEGLDGRIWAISEENQGTSIIISLKKYKGDRC